MSTLTLREAQDRAALHVHTRLPVGWTFAHRDHGDAEARCAFPWGAEVRLATSHDLVPGAVTSGEMILGVVVTCNTAVRSAAQAMAVADAFAAAARLACSVEADLRSFTVRIGPAKDDKRWERSEVANDHHRANCPVWGGDHGCACGGEQVFLREMEKRR